MKKLALTCMIAAALQPAVSFAAAPQPKDWPRLKSAIGKNAALEARVAAIVAGMTLAQKVGQMTQPEIKSVTPAQVREHYIGSVLNGGGSWPGMNKRASAADWVALADSYHAASMATDMIVKVPVIWGTDAIHGHGNVYGATLFPHNIGLGAARDPALVGRIGAAVGKAVRATGVAWVFGPTLAVVRDDRWGRTYESFSEDGALVNSYGGAYVRALQGNFGGQANVVATAKHFLGDGGTDQGKDRGVNMATKAQMLSQHAQGYYSALAAGAQTVMASFNSWNDVAAGVDYGKMHGNASLLTGVLKTQMGFDGFVIGDWNGHAEVPGCRDDSCAQAINAGVDMIMVPDAWKGFIENTIAQVKAGQIPMARIDDAVTRIVRVKLRAGLFGKTPSANRYASKQEALKARPLAREAVRKSLVLLKNDGAVLPLARGKRILVVGRSADNMQNQAGGWSLTWQGTDNKNSDYPDSDTILAAITDAAGAANVEYSADPAALDLSRFDAVIAVIGEGPYAEGDGDIGPGGTLRHSARHPEDLAALAAVSGKGKPVVTVFMAGRPLYVNDLLNLSDSFVAAWLPGSEGKGVTDVLFRDKRGKVAHDFTGKLSFSWPKSACQTGLNVGDAGYAPLFAHGYGLSYRRTATLGRLATPAHEGGCGVTSAFPVFNQTDRASFPLAIVSGGQRSALGADLNSTFSLPGVSVQTSQINTQQDAKLVTWSGPARFEARAAAPRALPGYASADGVLQFDTLVSQSPQGKVEMTIGCGPGCAGTLDVTKLFAALAGKPRQSVKIPLACFAAKGARFEQLDMPFSVASDAPFAAAFTNLQIVGGAAKDKDAVNCKEAL
ncbi:glycoside hydrolase family 3 protein [Massilia glaciei]|uniref:Glycoside hydrolase family 3 protein n=1 Tax=Massilia glaciei TaxID=1524097 RepID=A0A2U2HIC5_9BURK|nr:glycoside hydrolase family 3 N-terminal domain-containing protein [Massilia glaciei]PWF46100.1 glycoside hydrolase family 3 protein [Massilia glaciei]